MPSFLLPLFDHRSYTVFARNKDVPSPDVLYQQVVQALGLTPDDVTANRAGRLSAAQQAEFQHLMHSGNKAMLIIVPLVLIITVVGFGLQLSTMSNGQSLIDYLSDNPIIIVGLGGTLLLYLVMVAYALLRNNTRDISSLTVKSIDGKVKITKTSVGGVIGGAMKMGGATTTSYMLQVGRKRIYSTNAGVEAAFVKGGLYRIYFVKMSNVGWFVSAEAVRTA